jgi:CHAT domain-containing protein/predicted negative regulator of RcsB-dependent stress response
MSSTRSPAFLGALLASSVVVLLPLVSRAACDPVMSGQRPLLEKSFDVRGRERVGQSLTLPPKTNVFVFATEHGIDVTLEVSRSSRALARADSSVRRTGVQRLTILTGTDSEIPYVVHVIGKEEADVSGKVEIRVAVAPNDACADVQRTLATADANFAAGQAVTQGIVSPTPAADAPSAYAAAAKAYIAASRSPGSEGSSLLLAQTQHAAAGAMIQGREWTQAENLARQAAASYTSARDSYGRARAQALQAEALMEIAWSPSPSTNVSQTLEQARTLLTSLASFHAQRGERFDEALALNNIGLTYYQEERDAEAIRVFSRALPIYEGLGSRVRQAQVLQNIALAERGLGRLPDAIERYARVLELITPKDEPRPYAIVLTNSALANRAIGNMDAALAQYGQALELFRALQDERWQAQSLHGIGSVYDSMGDRDLALEFYRQALPLRHAQQDARGRAFTLSAIANLVRAQGKADEALAMHEEALTLMPSGATAERLRVHVAVDLDALGRRDEARRQLQAVLGREDAGEDFLSAHALLVRSGLELPNGDLKRAESDARRAQEIFRKFEAPSDELAAWVALATVLRQRGNRPQAFAALDQAMALAEEVRTQSANPELRATVMQPLRPVFELRLAMLAANASPNDAGLAMQALTTAEQARMRALADFRRLETPAGAVAPQRLQQRKTLYRELSSRRFQLEAHLNRASADDTRATSLRAEIAGIRQQLDRVNAELGSLATRADAGASFDARKAIDLRKVPADTAIVEYWLGESSALAWVVTREGLAMIDLGPTDRITSAAREFHAALRGFGVVSAADRLQRGESLYRLVLQPLEARFARKRTLIFAPDGALHYVPFAALRSGSGPTARFLVDSHDVAVTSSINLLLEGGAGKSIAHAKQMLIVDDPVYEADDARIAALADGGAVRERKTDGGSLWLFRGASDAIPLRRLPGTGREADTIVSLLPKEGVVRLEGFSATRERFLRADLGQYRFIHVASHAVTDSEIPQLSALILSTVDRQGRKIDGRVLAADLMDTELRADAVVLSACDTAMGKNISGEGLVGLRYALLARGARSVMSSFWPVSDRAAEQLMTRFYSSLLRGKVSLIAASSDAMRGMRSGPFADPALWAAFAVTVGGIETGEPT